MMTCYSECITYIVRVVAAGALPARISYLRKFTAQQDEQGSCSLPRLVVAQSPHSHATWRSGKSILMFLGGWVGVVVCALCVVLLGKKTHKNTNKRTTC